MSVHNCRQTASQNNFLKVISLYYKANQNEQVIYIIIRTALSQGVLSRHSLFSEKYSKDCIFPDTIPIPFLIAAVLVSLCPPPCSPFRGGHLSIQGAQVLTWLGQIFSSWQAHEIIIREGKPTRTSLCWLQLHVTSPPECLISWAVLQKGRLQVTAKLRGQTTSASIKCLKCSLFSTVYFLLFCNFSLAIYTKGAIHSCEINPHSFLYWLYMLLRRWKVKLDIFLGLLHCSSSFQLLSSQSLSNPQLSLFT